MKLLASVGYMVLDQRRENDIRQKHPDYVNQRRVMQQQCRRYMTRLGQVSHDWWPGAGNGLAKREGLAKAMNWARFQQGTALIIYSLDTIHLSPIESALLMLAFREWSVRVFEATTDSELTEQVGRWQEIVRSSGVESCAVANQALGEVKKLATRLWTNSKVGRKPFGEGVGEQEILKRIWELRRKKRDRTGRHSYAEIAKRLNDDEVKTRQGKQWHAKTIQGIVKRTKPHLDKD